MGKFWSANVTTGASDVDNVITIPRKAGKQIVIRYLRVVGCHATSDLRMFAPGNKTKTAVSTAVTANGDSFILNGDAGVNDTLNGEAIDANDWLLLKLDTPRFLDRLGAWQLLMISSVGGGTAGKIDIDDALPCDGENDPQNAAAVGNEAHCILAEDVYTEIIGAATKVFDGGDNAAIFSGKPGFPVALHLEAGDGVAHEMQVTAEYVDV